MTNEIKDLMKQMKLRSPAPVAARLAYLKAKGKPVKHPV
jgi:hypothetical protein